MSAPPAPLDPRAALDAIGLLPDSEIDIAEAALQLARVDAPQADWNAAREELSAIAREAVAIAARITQADLSAQAEALAGLLAIRHGYRGDAETYDDLANANLIRVIERRKGIPVALGILWLHAARAAGLGAHGVNFPMHFLVALEGRGTQLVIDVFAGGEVLEARQLRALLKRVEGKQAELRPGLLQPMNTRDVLLRLQNNIKARRLDAGDLQGALTTVEDMLRIAPDHAMLWREAGLMHQRLDHVGAALRCFERFLTLIPQGELAQRIRTLIEELRGRLN
ncbi:MAG: transglutaminase family protein [Acetobacteraceae bacterium]|nr:transglutaminase family protein [Acetobacteraceae bacterium]